jgi:DNA-binding NtrC family response regulator
MRRGDALDVMMRDGPETTPLVLVGRSAAAERLREDIRAASDASCLLIESEAGLEASEVAREVHARSGRGGPFVAVECAATEPAQVERELFGEPSRRASSDVEAIAAQSALALARRGTLYLGDISELSAAAQARLARVARDGEVRLAGDGICRLDVSIIASTATDLESEATEGRLRSDLLRRFTRTRIAVPALRRRADDIPVLIDHLVAFLCEETGTPRKTLTQAAVTLLAAMPWRSNLRELRHAISRLVATVPKATIQLEDVLAHVRFDGALAPHAPSGSLRTARQQFERDYIALVLQHHHWRVGDAARALGIQRTNLYRKARQLGISVARAVQHS